MWRFRHTQIVGVWATGSLRVLAGCVLCVLSDILLNACGMARIAQHIYCTSNINNKGTTIVVSLSLIVPTGAGFLTAIPVHWLAWFSNGSLSLSVTVSSLSGSRGVGDPALVSLRFVHPLGHVNRWGRLTTYIALSHGCWVLNSFTRP